MLEKPLWRNYNVDLSACQYLLYKMTQTLKPYHNHITLPPQDKLYQDDYQVVVSEEEKEEIVAKLKEASEWMDEEGYSATTKQLREKLSQLKALCKDMFFRVEERSKWPDRLAALESMLNTSSFFLR